MSAQETTPGQARSSAALAASMTSKPRRLGLFGGPSFSGCGLAGVGSSRTEASQPCAFAVVHGVSTTRSAGHKQAVSPYINAHSNSYYLDEAVVEEHADEPGADAGVPADGVSDDALDDGLGLRAPVVVVPDLEPAGGSRAGRSVVASRCHDQQRAREHGGHLARHRACSGDRRRRLISQALLYLK